MDATQLVKNYLQVNNPGFLDANIDIDSHSGASDSHFVRHIDAVNSGDVNHDEYQIATVTKNITLGDGLTIPKIFKFTIRNNQIDKIVESK